MELSPEEEVVVSMHLDVIRCFICYILYFLISSLAHLGLWGLDSSSCSDLLRIPFVF